MTEGVGRVIVDATTEDTLAVDSSGRVAIQDQPNMDVAASTLATETTAAGIKTGTDKLPADPAREGGNLATLAAKDFATSAKQDTLIGHVDAVEGSLSSIDGKVATQTTLASVLGQLDITLGQLRDALRGAGDKTLTDVETTLDAIKDTDGVKKITDQLPAGTNNIGSVDAWAHDGAGNEIASVVVETIRRLEQRGVLTSPDGTQDVDVILDAENGNVNRLQAESLLAPGSQVNIGTGVPSNPSDLVIDFCHAGAAHNMLVNGSGTPVNYDFTPPAGEIYAIQELLIVFAAGDFEFDGASFGPRPSLTNGIAVQTIVGATPVTTTLAEIIQNEDFLRLPGRPPLVNNTGPKDILGASLVFGGLVKLHGDDGDKIRLIVRDNLTSVKFTYLTATVFATKE